MHQSAIYSFVANQIIMRVSDTNLVLDVVRKVLDDEGRLAEPGVQFNRHLEFKAGVWGARIKDAVGKC